jgi:hypothetical protein
MSGSNSGTPTNEGFSLPRPFGMNDRSRTPTGAQGDASPSVVRMDDVSPSSSRGRTQSRDGTNELSTPVRCINPASDINSRLDTQVEVRVYPCNNSQGGGKKKFTTFTIKPEVSIGSTLLAVGGVAWSRGSLPATILMDDRPHQS